MPFFKRLEERLDLTGSLNVLNEVFSFYSRTLRELIANILAPVNVVFVFATRFKLRNLIPDQKNLLFQKKEVTVLERYAFALESRQPLRKRPSESLLQTSYYHLSVSESRVINNIRVLILQSSPSISSVTLQNSL